MASRAGDVAGTVHDVVAAFDKAVNLVRRIEDRKDVQHDPEAVRDLFKSLSLGPVIVQGYFDADAKRFGPPYLIGDYQAQLELRDVLLGLKNLVGDLSDVLLDDCQIDFRQLQETSDTCRSNAGVSLGQLSQRLATSRDPMSMHMQSPPQQYMSGVPPMASPSLHYSSSRSTHSSNGGRIPQTPEPYKQQPVLSPQWQPQKPVSDEQYPPHHQRQSTEASIQENYAHWSQPAMQPYNQRDADELSVRRPSSHTLAPEDGCLLSPGLPPEDTSRPSLLPGQQDLVRDSYTSFTPPAASQPSVRESATSSNYSRERYGPDDFSPLEEHGPFRLDRDSTTSVTAYASRAFNSSHSTLEHVSSDYRHSAEPQPLKLPHRPAGQPPRHFSDGPQGPPPRKPIPPVPYDSGTSRSTSNKSTESSSRLPGHVYGQRVPIPPRSQSRPTVGGNDSPQRVLSPPPQGPPFQPSPQVQRAIQNDQARRQYNFERSPHHTPPQSMPSPPLSKTSSVTNSIASSQQLYSAQREPLLDSPSKLIPASPPRSNPPPPPPTLSTTALTTSIPLPANLPLTLPTDKNTQPFCKGAFRLFVGLQKKAFTSANRPVGMSSFIPYWRCDKCLFEGPMHQMPGPPDKKGRPGKPEKVFDPTIRECGPISSAVIGPDGRGEGSGGIRFKWAFLAKCHVPLKTVPEGKPDGTFGGYGCIFCTAEGQARGWTMPSGSVSLGMNGPGLNDAASTYSGKSGHSVSSSSVAGNTPVFGNLKLFMDHLQMHRLEANWPCPEMRGRMKCIVGRIADRNEDWEVNFLPH